MTNGNASGNPAVSNQKEDEQLPGSKIGFIDITEIKEEGADRPTVCPTSKRVQAPKQQKDKYAEYALVLRRKYNRKPGKNSEPVFDQSVLEVYDETLRKAIRHALGDYPFSNLSTTPIEIKAPYRELFYYRKELSIYVDSSDRSPDEREKLQMLADFMTNNLQSTTVEYEKHVPHGNTTQELLWTLYRPNSLIVTRRNEVLRCFRVKAFNQIQKKIQCYYWSYLKGRFGRVLHSIAHEIFEGVQKITRLSVVPFDFLPDEQKQSVRDILVKRGRRWQSLCKMSHMVHTGIANRPHKILDDTPSWERALSDLASKQYEYTYSQVAVEGRVIVDPDTYLKHHPGALPPHETRDVTANEDFVKRAQSSPVTADSSAVDLYAADIFQPQERSSSNRISDSQAMIATPNVYGFGLMQKIWGEYSVDNVKEIDWDTTCFDKLALETNIKSTLRRLVQLHETSRKEFRDVVARKGVGRAFLLHGPPGSGKTLTAETIAEHVKKPLYYATSGELGTDVKKAETSLERIFELAQTWEAVLLIDEADVFLTKRAPTDIERNAFVSIFLRTLEYYQGIIILTTNRHEDFDEAFESRIHVSIQYDLPDADQRLTIWKNLFDQWQDLKTFDDGLLRKLASDYEINGRAIKNLFSTALALTEPGATIKQEDIQRLYAMNQPRSQRLSAVPPSIERASTST